MKCQVWVNTGCSYHFSKCQRIKGGQPDERSRLHVWAVCVSQLGASCCPLRIALRGPHGAFQAGSGPRGPSRQHRGGALPTSLQTPWPVLGPSESPRAHTLLPREGRSHPGWCSLAAAHG